MIKGNKIYNKHKIKLDHKIIQDQQRKIELKEANTVQTFNSLKGYQHQLGVV